MEDTSSTKTPASPLRDEGLLALMRAFPLDILGKVVFDVLSISDETFLWAEDSAFRTVYTWCMATHRESGLRRRREGVWPLIRSTVAVFSQDGFDWTDKVGSFRRHRLWRRKKSPYGAVRYEWDMVKHGDIVLKHLCETGAVACGADTLAAAASAGAGTAVRYLVEERGVNPAADGNSAFRLAAMRGHADAVKYLLNLAVERGVDPSARNNLALRSAAANGHADVVKLLVDLPPKRGVEVGAFNFYAFHAAAANGHVGVVSLLLGLPLERGIDPSAGDDLALRYAAANGHVSVVKLLVDLPVERRVNVGADDNYALRTAAKNGHAKVVKLILDTQTDDGDPSTGSNLVLPFAALYGHTDVLRLLLGLPFVRRPTRAAVRDVLTNPTLNSGVSGVLQNYLDSAP